MFHVKPWYKSKTVAMVLVSALAHAMMALGIDDETAGELLAIAGNVAPFVGLLADTFALWARSRAEGPLTLTQDDTRLH